MLLLHMNNYNFFQKKLSDNYIQSEFISFNSREQKFFYFRRSERRKRGIQVSMENKYIYIKT